MKISTAVILLMMFGLMTSCMSTTFYQTYDVLPVNATVQKTDHLYYEDSNCVITYNFWSEGGNVGFYFLNKTDEPIKVNLKESYFVLNGYAFDYFKNRTYERTENKSASNSVTKGKSVAETGLNTSNRVQTNKDILANTTNLFTSVGQSVAMKEDSVITIPPGTIKSVAEYQVNRTLIRDCELLRYPTKNKVQTKIYSQDQSPLVFGNLISYETNDQKVNVKNEFYVSGVTNYPRSDFYGYEFDEYCDQKSTAQIQYFKLEKADRFYLKYSRDQGVLKH